LKDFGEKRISTFIICSKRIYQLNVIIKVFSCQNVVPNITTHLFCYMFKENEKEKKNANVNNNLSIITAQP